MSKPKCSNCKHYYITWNAKIPNGCKLYGIQCKDQPSNIIMTAGMGECQGFEAKKKVEKKNSGLDLNRNDLW